ncbi:MAG: 4-hydroxy-tetrahydrodipicolinate reductase [Deltaproteobacteria bacterium]|nr:4-hydroxy-tetrahydrodipicolinate reductase [Deltaproteobacteria bacterium]
MKAAASGPGLPLVLVGAAGRMGREVAALARAAGDVSLVAALEAPGSAALGRPLADAAGGSGRPAIADLAAWDPATAPAGTVVVEFSSPAGLRLLCERLDARPLPLVSGTTGLGPEDERRLDVLAERAAVLHAPNMSLGVAAARAAAGLLARALGDGFDVELVELHHGAKRDAPSGTALALARAVAEARGEPTEPVLDRTARGRPRESGGVGVASLRGGTVVGEHTLFFLGEDERVELTHRAGSRRVFARGALRCARWLAGRGPGRHRIDDVLRPGRSG